MDPAGGNFGGRITTVKKRCLACGCTLLIVAMRPEYRYSVSAMTDEESDARDKKRRRLRELEEEAGILRREIEG
jgi:hypothetical protein